MDLERDLGGFPGSYGASRICTSSCENNNEQEVVRQLSSIQHLRVH